MGEEPPVEVEYRGHVYRRYPESSRRKDRVYYGSRARGRSFLHRDKWADANGPIPRGWHIHHRDWDPFNNDLANLQCVSPKEHAELHATRERAERNRANLLANAIPAAVEWHRSPEGRAWHREHGARTWEGREPEHVFSCSECGVEVKSYFAPGEGPRFCSKECSRRRIDREGRYLAEYECPVCGGGYWDRKWGARKQTCSRKCGAAWRKEKAGRLQLARERP